VDVCVLGRYYTYLDIWVKRVISLNIKNSNDRFIHTSSLSFFIFIACLLYMYARYSFWCLLLFDFINTHILIFARHLAFTWIFVGELLTPLNLHVQVLKLGLKRSPRPKIKLISRRRPTSPCSFCSWIFLQVQGTSSQLVSTLFTVQIVILTFVPGRDIIYMY